MIFHNIFTPEQDNDNTNVEPVHSYYAFHTRSDMSGVTGIVGMHRFNICLVVVLLWCENTIKKVSPPVDMPSIQNIGLLGRLYRGGVNDR